MKKIKTILISILCLLAPTLMLWGCGAEDFGVSFKEESLKMELGTSYDIFELLDYNENLRDKIWFKSGNNAIIYITTDNQVVAEKVGSTFLYAYIGKVEDAIQLCFCFVDVIPNKIPFNAPVNLSFDNESRMVNWNHVYADSGDKVVRASSYTLEITYELESPKEIKVMGNSYGPLSRAGSYDIRVKTNAGGIFLASDYSKDNEGEYKYFKFNIATVPNNIEFDKETSTLKWDANSNLEETQYFVFVNDENVSGTNGTNDCSIVLNVDNAGEYQIYVEARPNLKQGYDLFSSQSEKIVLTRLEMPLLSFDNEILSWQSQDNVAFFEVIVTNLFESDDPQYFETNENFFNLSCISAGNFTVSVRAIGNLTDASFPLNSLGEYSLTGKVATSEFNKLETAILKYNETNNTFSVLNNNGHDVLMIFKNINTGVETPKMIEGNEGEVNAIFDLTGFAIYSIQAKILAKSDENQVDGNFSAFFSLSSDQNAELKFVQRVQAPEIFYSEDNEKSYIGFSGTADSFTSYTLLSNGENMVDINENTFDLGNTKTFFENAGLYEFILTVEKEIKNQTYYLKGTSALNVQKLETPLSVRLKESSTATNMAIEVFDNVVDLSKVQETKIFINNVETSDFNINENEFSVRAIYLANSSFELINGTKTFFTSGNELTCSFERLTSPTALNFDYESQRFSWESVGSAEKYAIYIDGIFEEETNETYFDYVVEKSYEFSVYALPTISQIGFGGMGLLPSKSADLEIYKTSAVKDLKLLLDDIDGRVIAQWSAPEGLPSEISAHYDILIDGTSVFEDLEDYTTEMSFKFAENAFDLQKTYMIIVNVKDTARDIGGKFYEPTSSVSVILTRLNSISKIDIAPNVEHVGGTISATDYDQTKMQGLYVGVNGGNVEFANGNSYAFSEVENGDTINFQISYCGIFNSDLGKYYLDSIPVDFSVSKLNSPINLNFDSDIFSWNTLDDIIYNNGINSPFEFKFFTTLLDNNEKSSETSTTQLEIEVLNLMNAAKLWVYEATLSIGDNGKISVSAGDTAYLNSSAVYLAVNLENEIENLTMEFTMVDDIQKILLLWEFESTVDPESPEYLDYLPKFLINVSDSSDIVLDISLSATETYTGEGNLYSYILNLSDFEIEGDYLVSVSAFSNKTLFSVPDEITITKLGSANYACLNDFDVLLLKGETEEISLVGATGVELTGDISFTTNRMNTFSLYNFIEIGETLTVNVKVLAISPENITDRHFYLDSEQTVFMFLRFANIVPIIDFESESLVWTKKLGATFYDLRISQGIHSYFINELSENSISLNDIRLNQIIYESGTYDVYVKAMAQLQVIVANSTDSNAIGFVSGDFSSSIQIDKLQKVENIVIFANDTNDDDIAGMAQKKIVINWQNVPNATAYDVWISNHSGYLGDVCESMPANVGQGTFLETIFHFANRGDYFVSIIAKSSTAISSTPSNQIKIIRLDFISQESMSLSSGSLLEWDETIQTSLNLVDCCYFVEIFNSSHVRVHAQMIDQNNLNLANNGWINNHADGEFFIKIKVKGNGNLQNAMGGVVTLSSNAEELSVYKLQIPQINLYTVFDENKLIVYSDYDTGRFTNLIDFFITISYNGQDLKVDEQLERDLSVDDNQIGIFTFPDNWLAGNYSFKVYSAVRDSSTPNLLKSSVFEGMIEKLVSPTSSKVEAVQTNPDDVSQENVKISWSSVVGATHYMVFIDDEVAMIQPAMPMPENFWIVNHHFQSPGRYKIQIKAMGMEKISSLLTSPIYVVRLNSIDLESASVNIEAETVWAHSEQLNPDFAYCIIIEDLVHQRVQTIKDLSSTASSYLKADFEASDWYAWLNDYIGGNFFVSIIVQGNGSSQYAYENTATLSSEPCSVTAFKFFAPSITVEDNILTITNDTVNDVEKSQINYKIYYGNEVKAEGVYSEQIILPDEWGAGDYVIEAYVTTKSGEVVKNHVNSKVERLEIEKLSQVNDVVVSAADASDIFQKVIKISWGACESAEIYDIYINSEKVLTIEPQFAEDFYEITREDIMQENGEYVVEIVAKAEGFIISDYSNSVIVIRLNPITSADMVGDISVSWKASEQESNDFTYYLELLEFLQNGENVQGSSPENLGETSYAGFASNQWLTEFEGGTFGVSVYVIGNGSSVDNDEEQRTATLTSQVYQFNVLKLFAPQIQILPERLELEIVDASVPISSSSELTIGEVSGLKFSIRQENGDFAKDENDINIDNLIYDNSFFYPEAWASGAYQFYALNFPNRIDVKNVIASVESMKQAERLTAPTNLKFSRDAVENLNDYTCDIGTNPDFLNENLSFSFQSVENANNYLLLNGNFQIVAQSNDIDVVGELEWLLNRVLNETRTLKVVASGSISGDITYINSPCGEIEFKRLNQVQNFFIEDGKINWNSVIGATAYLIKATDEDGVIKFWQSENQTITSSYLNGILEDLNLGQVSLNIKALSTLESDSVVSLDSSYMDVDIEFFKLETPSNFKSFNGFLSCDAVENAESYRIFVYSEDDVFLFSDILDDYTERFNSEIENKFIGFSSEVYSSLLSETLYKVKIQAISENHLQILYSDLTSSINIKTLSNVNELDDICLEFNPNGMLDQTRLNVNVAVNSYGLVQIGDTNISLFYSGGEPEPFPSTMTIRSPIKMPNDIGGNHIQFSLASLGGSDLVIDDGVEFYYLNSSITKSRMFYVLETPILRNERGIIKWDIVEGAEGYYVYINDALYGDDIYRFNLIDLSEEYGNLEENTLIDLKVIAVSDTLETIFSADGLMQCEIISGDLKKDFLIDLIKLKTPNLFDIVDGALVFSNGIFTLEDYDVYEIINFLEVVAVEDYNASVQLENYNALMQYIEQLFLSPLVIYSPYIGFDFPELELRFQNSQTGNVYNVNINSKNFLTLTEEQRDKFSDFRARMLNLLPPMIAGLENVSINFEAQNRPLQEIEEVNELIDLHKLLLATIQGVKINEILELYNKPKAGWPNLDSIFNEFDETSQMPGGNYILNVRQIGNARDWLSSNYNDNLNVFLPKAVSQIEIDEQEGDFILLWNKADVPSSYLPLDVDGDGVGDGYILYGEDYLGKRYEILRTNGCPSGTNNKLQLNLSTLIDNGILTDNIVKFYIVVAGDSQDVLSGIPSLKLDITILPHVTPYMNDGTLIWDSMPSVLEYEIVATAEGCESLREVIVGTLWNGENLELNAIYNIKIRAIGEIYRVADSVSYVLSGQHIQFNLTKLSEMNVVVDKYGIFRWATVANAQGFSVEISDTEFRYVKTGGFDLKFESDYLGFHNYFFKAIGTTGSINLSSSTVYYLNSEYNNNNNGLLAALLPKVESIWVENGIIKFTPIPEVLTEDLTQLEKVVGYRLTVEIGIGEFFTTELEEQIFKDANGNICFDFSNYGSNDIYNITVQAYIYYVNETETIFENAKSRNLNDGQLYHRLLGESNAIEFEKISAPTSIRIEDGQIAWDDVYGADGYIIEIFTNTTNKLIVEQTTLTTWWTNDILIVPQNSYFFRVKAFALEKAFSNYTTYFNYIAEEPKEIKRLQPLENVTTTINTYTNEQDENFISFAYPDSGLDMGFNLKYKTEIDGEYFYVLTSDGDYNEIINYLNEVVTINVSKIENSDIDFMEYQIQCVPKGNSGYLKSRWGINYIFSIPESVANVFYDEDSFEFFWQHVGNNFSYIVADEILDADGNCIAVFKYKIKTDHYAGQNYYKQRTLQGETETVATISYLPSIVGYVHRVSVAVCLDTSAELSLVSQFTQCEELCEFDLFEVESGKDILAIGSPIYNTIDGDLIAQYLLNNAYGTALNPYLIKDANDFAKINLRLLRYNYTYDYSVQLNFEFNEQQVEILTFVHEVHANYHFKQTTNLVGLTQPLGIWSMSSGSIKYQSFQNTFDGNNKTISISITAPRSDLYLGLFLSLGNGAVVKNLIVEASVDFKAIIGSTFTFGAIVGRNDGGNIINCHVRSIDVIGLVDNENRGIHSLTFGGIVGENKSGKVELCTTSSEIELILFLANSGNVIYAGGISGKNSGTITSSGNSSTLDIVGKNEAYVGGIVGMNTGIVEQSYNKSQIKGTTLLSASTCNIGGIVGKNHDGIIKNSYNIANVACGDKPWPTGTKIYLGGIVGYTNVSTITNCYSTMSTVNSDDALVAGTLAGHIQQSILSGFGPKNIYLNNEAVGYAVNGKINFAEKVTMEQLMLYAETLNIAAENDIFENTESCPRFKWEQNALGI